MPMLSRLRCGLAALLRRLRDGGPAHAWQWLHGHAWPCVRGVPTVRFSRVTPTLYVGPQIGRAGRRWLERRGVRASVNLRAEFDDRPAGLALSQHLWLPTIDDEAPTLEQLAEGVAFIGRVVAERGSVYVHCQSGVGRAPTLAAAWLMHEGMAVGSALALLRRVRPFVCPTPPQIEQLHRFGMACRPTRPAT